MQKPLNQNKYRSFYDASYEQALPILQKHFEKLRGKSLLITGANGLLGSHLLYVCARLSFEKNLDLKITAISKSKARPWIHEFADSWNIQWESMDLGSKASEVYFTGKFFDFVIHAATYGQPKKFIADPLQTMKLNTSMTELLLNTCKDSFLFMSTSELYGSSGDEKQSVHENYPAKILAQDPRAVYSSTKLYSEVLCNTYTQLNRCNAKVARVSSVFGPGVDLNDDRVLNLFILRALREGIIRLQDQGQQKRKWLYISDAVRMFFHILLDSKDWLYNVSGSEFCSIKDLAMKIAGICKVEATFPQDHYDNSENHLKDALNIINMDNRKILSIMDNKELIDMQSGLEFTIDWYKKLLDSQS